MPLSNESRFGVRALSEAINALPVTPTPIRELALFKQVYLTTTYVDVEHLQGRLQLVKSQERGSGGDALPARSRTVRTFKIPHLPVDDVIRADDVQNVRGFGSTEAQTVESAVNDKLADAKQSLEYTREHLMLGALLGKIADADGSLIYDLYDEFGIQRPQFTWALATASTEVGMKIDQTITALRKNLKGEFVKKWVVLASSEFMQALKYHKSVKPLYERYRDGAAYREGAADAAIELEMGGVQFVQYDGMFDDGVKIAEGEAIILPQGARSTFAEYFAPADMNATVNSKALAYYASREKLRHDKGWSLSAQSNPLPLVLRPDLVATIKA